MRCPSAVKRHHHPKARTHLDGESDGQVPGVARLRERDDAEEQRGDVVRDERRRAAQHARRLHEDPRRVHRQVRDERVQQHAGQPEVLHAQRRRAQLRARRSGGWVNLGVGVFRSE